MTVKTIELSPTQATTSLMFPHLTKKINNKTHTHTQITIKLYSPKNLKVSFVDSHFSCISVNSREIPWNQAKRSIFPCIGMFCTGIFPLPDLDLRFTHFCCCCSLLNSFFLCSMCSQNSLWQNSSELNVNWIIGSKS